MLMQKQLTTDVRGSAVVSAPASGKAVKYRVRYPLGVSISIIGRDDVYHHENMPI